MSTQPYGEVRAGQSTDPDWALVLTGGGNRGAIQAGALRALFETGFRPGLIVGVSVGAINGSYLAFHPSETGVADLIEIWRGLDGKQLFGTRHVEARTWLAFMLGRPAAFTSRGLRRLLESELPGRLFADTRVPLAVTATHLETGTGRVITQGSVVDAVLASSALPGFLPPVIVAGERLVDGAVADPMPLHVVTERGLSRAVVVDPGHACRCPRVYETALSVIQQSVAVMTRHSIMYGYQSAGSSPEVVHIGLSCHDDLPFTDFSHADQMIESGYAEASEILHRRPGGFPWSSGRHRFESEAGARMGTAP